MRAAPRQNESAKAAGLRYVSDDEPGIRRKKRGQGFTYVDPTGNTVRDASLLERIRKLAIPPAWTEVWICPIANGHLQAIGRDSKKRKQYRYHPEWRHIRDETKFGRMVAFGEALPRLRRRVEADLSLPGLPREKVVATVVRLLETTLIRVGNREYARQNGSFGLTTLRDGHVQINGSRVRFEFRGKSGKDQSAEVQDRRVARIVRQCRDLPGQTLFQYVDESGDRQRITSEDINGYVREATGKDFTAKDFRTWGGTVLALSTLLEVGRCESEKEANQAVVSVVKRVAEELGNRPVTCRKYYIHPALIAAFVEGKLAEAPVGADTSGNSGDLSALEARMLLLLRGVNGSPRSHG